MGTTGRLWVVLVLNLLLIGALVVVGISANSLGVLAEGGDYIADAAAIGISLVAIALAKRPPSPDRPRGYDKATTIAAAINSGWLLVLSLLVAVGAVVRLVRGTPVVHGLPVLVVSAVAAVVMLGCAVLLANDDQPQSDTAAGTGATLNMRAVLLDTATDAVAAAGVAVSGAVILASGGLYWLDPAVALVIALVVAYHAARLLREVVDALRSPPATAPEARR